MLRVQGRMDVWQCIRVGMYSEWRVGSGRVGETFTVGLLVGVRMTTIHGSMRIQLSLDAN